MTSRRGFAGLAVDSFPAPLRAPHPSHLEEPIAEDKRTRTALASLRPRPLRTVDDLLEHVPFRYDDFSRRVRIADLRPGEEATIVCTVDGVRLRRTRRRNLVIIEARVHDDSGPGVVVWFNQRYLSKQLQPGMVLSIRGERRASIEAEIAAKSHEILDADGDQLHTLGLVPVYRAGEKIGSRRLRVLAAALLPHAGDRPDPLPSPVRSCWRLPLRRDAIHASHQPRSWHEARRAQTRLAFEELFLLQVGLIRHRRALERTSVAPELGQPGELSARFLEVLGFAADRRAAACDRRHRPRCRPQHPDAAAAAGRRRIGQDRGGRARPSARRRARRPGRADGADRDPGRRSTWEASRRCCQPLGVRVTAWSTRLPAAERRAALGVIESGEPQIVVGTHALIQDAVVFGDLELVVVDEQHRFGVEQRQTLAAKAEDSGASPHVLHMTATPIPRTLALTVYGDLDVSILDELPPGRTPVITRLVPTAPPRRGVRADAAAARPGPAGLRRLPAGRRSPSLRRQRPPRARAGGWPQGS